MTEFIIGIDAGGSKTHGILVNAHNHSIISEAFGLPANIKTNFNKCYLAISSVIENLNHKCQQLSKEEPHKIIAIRLGIAGFNAITTNKKAKFRQLLGSYSKNIIVTSDIEIAALAAHGPNSGITIICGTGVAACVCIDGNYSLISGWGFPHGDLGGGAYLGLELCRHLCQAIDCSDNIDGVLSLLYQKFNYNKNTFRAWLLRAGAYDYGQIGKLVVDNHNTDQIANTIFINGLSYVKNLIKSLLKTNPKLPIKLSGGLSTFYLSNLQSKFPSLSITNDSPAYGATFLL